ncbi:MAG: hypothetical protein LBE37_10145, partial [Sphingobacterium sp.]|nr:hypothetical protein [Sphingobacterium sp.]
MKSFKLPALLGVLFFLVLLLATVSCKDKEEAEPVIEVPEPEEVKLPDTLKVISYNILEGMKNDKANNY